MKFFSKIALFIVGIEVLVIGTTLGNNKSVAIATTSNTTVTASFAESAFFYFEDFEGYPIGSDPLDWLDTAANNSMSEDDSLFNIHQVAGNQVLGTDSSQRNIHSHFLGAGADSLTGYQYAGRMRIANSSGGIGVTLLSQYNNQDAYYRLRRYDAGDFHFSPHGTTVSGDTSTGVVPAAHTWYNFVVEVEDTGTRTELRAKVWAEGTPEPAGWQADAFDDSVSRLTVGTFGLWSHRSGGKYWDDLAVALLSPPVTYTLTTNTAGNGDVTADPDLAAYPDGTVVTLTAVPDSGSSFEVWSGDLSGSSNPATITMDGDKSITASFTQDEYILTIVINGSGAVTVDPLQATYHYGDLVTLTAVPGVDWLFTGWSGDLSGNDNPANITITSDTALTANFVEQGHTLTVNTSGNGAVTADPDLAAYPDDTVVTLTAAPGPGYSFAGWSGDLSGSSNPATITMDGDKSVTASFTQDEYVLTTVINGSGAVTVDPLQATYHYGDLVTLTAVSDPGYSFAGWSGDLSGNDNPAVLVITSDSAVTASFIDSSTMSWVHLSSASGDLPTPSGSSEQTAALILDVNKDGLEDFVIGARHAPGPSLVWYQRHSNGWTKHIIDDTVLPIEAGGAVHDIDGDDDLDVVMGAGGTSNEVWWWENPYPNFQPSTSWIRRELKNSGANKHHDQIFGDFDGDGSAELVFWNQRANTLYLAEIPPDPLNTQPWSLDVIYTWTGNEHEGLAKADIDLDGKVDIVGGGRWFKHNGGTSYTANIIDDGQRFTRAAAGQLKAGGRPEVVFVIGDGIGRLQWYEWTGSSWVGHDLLGFDVDHGHSLQIADINNDGMQDIFNTEMRLNGGNDQAKMRIFYGNGDGTFTLTDIATGIGNHESKIGDLDGDGDLDILGKPFNWDTPRIDVWLNKGTSAGVLPLDQWQRKVIDDSRPWTAIFVTAADVDGDNFEDVITGGWWYKNPGDSSGSWTRNEIGSPLNNMATVFDFDGDDDMDILGTAGIGSEANDTFVWAHNNGSGQFTILANISSGDGNFLQGVAIDRFQNNELSVALSWHQANKGIQQFKVPDDPVNQTWPWSQISPVSQDEALSSGDIDKDGDADLLLGTKWLRNEGAGWTAFDLYTPNGQPDRNRLADINGDGKLDAIVGYEAISAQDKLAWYEQGETPTVTWTEHIVADPAIVGPMSLDVADMDGDGDNDIVVGEHNTANPENASLYIFENLDGQGDSWAQHLIYTGDEHHDGAHVVDIDQDGDLDIVSIGWTHNQVLLYENKALDSSGVTYDLIVNEVGQGLVEVEPIGPYFYNDVVTLTAMADPSWAFSEWSGDLSGSDNPVQLTMNADKVVTATFVEPTPRTLTVTEVGNGAVTINPDKPLYDQGEQVTLTAEADPGWTFSGWSGDLSGNINPVQLIMNADKSVTAHFISAYYAEDFEGNNAGDDPVDWYDSAANNSMAQDDSLFKVYDLGGNKVFGTSSTAKNIHSHYAGAGSESYTGYRNSGRMRMTSASSGIGVTMYSQYPVVDEYYRLRRYHGNAFHLNPHGTSLSGDIDTGVIPQANIWYHFIIEVENVGATTEVRAKVWQEGTTEPAGWQANAVDSTGDRLVAGTFGFWGHISGSKYWDDLLVEPLLP